MNLPPPKSGGVNFKSLGPLGSAIRRLRRPEELVSSRRPYLRAYAVLARVVRNAGAHDLNVLAAGIGLYAFLALVPFLASVAVIYGMFAEPQAVQSGVRSLLFMAPPRAQELVADRLLSLIGRWNGGLPTLLFGLLLTVYAAARAARSVLAALNLIHGYDRRGFLKRWRASLGICFVGGLVTLLALVAIAAGGYVGEWVARGPMTWLLMSMVFWLAFAAALSMLLALLYRYGPNGPTMRWREVAPGAVAASLAWLAGSLAFSVYVPVFARYDVTYGSLATVVVLQLWLYASFFVMLLGAQLNLEIKSAREEAGMQSLHPSGRSPGNGVSVSKASRT